MPDPIQPPQSSTGTSQSVGPESSALNVLAPPSPSQIRDELSSMVVKDLLGPAGGPEEELDKDEDRVRERYLVGMLAPRSTTVEASTMDELGATGPDDVEVGATEISATSRDTMFPSSMGMSFVVEPTATELLINTKWGHYKRATSTTQKRKDGSPALVWKREPITGEPQTVPLKAGPFGPLAPSKDQPLVKLRGRIRQSP